MSFLTSQYAETIAKAIPRAHRLGFVRDAVYECVSLDAAGDFACVSAELIAAAKTRGVLIEFADAPSGPHISVWAPRTALEHGIDTDAVRAGVALLVPPPPPY